MKPSLNEIGSLAMRASRGAGMTWGLAEEASRATRWLTQADLPGPELLATVLTLNDGLPSASLSPIYDRGECRAPAGRLCPIVVGVFLSDNAHLLQQGKAVVLSNVFCPLLMIPAVVNSAWLTGTSLGVRWGEVQILTDGRNTSIRGRTEQLMMPSTTLLCSKIERCEGGVPLTVSSYSRRKVDESSWESLLSFGSRLYAPATEESRRLGAGAQE